jgi:hypothetical protein
MARAKFTTTDIMAKLAKGECANYVRNSCQGRQPCAITLGEPCTYFGEYVKPLLDLPEFLAKYTREAKVGVALNPKTKVVRKRRAESLPELDVTPPPPPASIKAAPPAKPAAAVVPQRSAPPPVKPAAIVPSPAVPAVPLAPAASSAPAPAAPTPALSPPLTVVPAPRMETPAAQEPSRKPIASPPPAEQTSLFLDLGPVTSAGAGGRSKRKGR